LLKQSTFLKNIQTNLESQSTSILKDLESLRQFLANPNNIRIQVVADFFKVRNPKKELLTFIPKDKTFQKAESSKRLTNVHEFKTNQEGKAFLFPMSAIDNSFLIQSSKGILKFGHEDEAALRVVIEYLTTMEGYFFLETN